MKIKKKTINEKGYSLQLEKNAGYFANKILVKNDRVEKKKESL